MIYEPAQSLGGLNWGCIFGNGRSGYWGLNDSQMRMYLVQIDQYVMSVRVDS